MKLFHRAIAPIENTTSRLFSISGFQKIVQRLRAEIGLPSTFTLDACRHGGMTELEEAELTDGQGRALSGHKTVQAYAGYAKQTLERALPATRKRLRTSFGERRENKVSEYRAEFVSE